MKEKDSLVMVPRYLHTKKLVNILVIPKGQLILKCSFGVFKSPKKPTKFLLGFLLLPLKRGQIKKVVQESQNKIIQLRV